MHAIEFYHGDGCVKVGTIQMDKLWNMVLITEGERFSPKINQLEFFICCNKCRAFTDKQILPSAVYEYSTARFLEQFFYNVHNYKLRSELCKC